MVLHGVLSVQVVAACTQLLLLASEAH